MQYHTTPNYVTFFWVLALLLLIAAPTLRECSKIERWTASRVLSDLHIVWMIRIIWLAPIFWAATSAMPMEWLTLDGSARLSQLSLYKHILACTFAVATFMPLPLYFRFFNFSSVGESEQNGQAPRIKGIMVHTGKGTYEMHIKSIDGSTRKVCDHIHEVLVPKVMTELNRIGAKRLVIASPWLGSRKRTHSMNPQLKQLMASVENHPKTRNCKVIDNHPMSDTAVAALRAVQALCMIPKVNVYLKTRGSCRHWIAFAEMESCKHIFRRPRMTGVQIELKQQDTAA